MATSIQSILAGLPELRVGELQQVIERARALLVYAGKADTYGETSSPVKYEWLLDGLRAELKERGLPSNTPSGVVARLREYKEFEKAAVTHEPWLRSLVPANATRTLIAALAALAGRCLARHINEFRPVTLTALLHHYELVPDAIENSYPDYIKNGWLLLILGADR